MMMRKCFVLVLFFVVQNLFSQNLELSVFTIPDSLKENANAVVRNYNLTVDINSRRGYKVNETRVVTVLNELGLRHINAEEYYDKSTSVKEIEAVIYDAFGKEIKKFKKKDFKTISVTEGSVITDGRTYYMEYTPVQYPFTVVFQSEVISSNTAFLPKWMPISDYYLSVIKSSMIVRNHSGSKLRCKEKNFNENIVKSNANGLSTFSYLNAKAIKKEDLSPSISKLVPSVLFALNEFHLEGVDGVAEDWKAFGKWMYDNLLVGTDELSEETKLKIRELVGAEKDPLKKAKIIYDYVQKNTRYISIQLGIGGWKPMPAKDVARLGYGDCKALSNYTRVLLKEVGVPSLYTIVYGNENKWDLEEDFASLQGNHVILGIPINGNIQWLECTSQIQPFGFQGSFTDNRNVLVIAPDKSEIVKTKSFGESENIQSTDVIISLDPEGNIQCDVEKRYTGLQYDKRFQLENLPKEELENFYRKQFGQLNSMKFEAVKITNDKNTVHLTEKLVFKASNFVNLSALTLCSLNPLNQFSSLPSKYKNRMHPFEISRGNKYVDNITFTLPEGYRIDALPDSVEFSTEFGTYKLNIERNADGGINLKRELTLHEGTFENKKYEEYRKFRENIAKNENLKVAIVKN